MKSLSAFLNEDLNDKINKLEDRLNEATKNESITDEKSFREVAKTKFEKVYGDDLDEKKMNDTIDGLLNDNKDLVDKGEWGELIGMLNKSFGK